MKAAHKLRAKFIADRDEAMRFARDWKKEALGGSHYAVIIHSLVSAARLAQSQALKISKEVL